MFGQCAWEGCARPKAEDIAARSADNSDLAKVPRQLHRVLQLGMTNPLVCQDSRERDPEPFTFREPLFIRQTVALSGCKTPAPIPMQPGHGHFAGPMLSRQLESLGTELRLAWLTISTGTITFQDLVLRCKIQVTAHATFTANRCVFERVDDRCECAVEVFAGSHCRFTLCEFRRNGKAALVVRDHSDATVTHSKFNQSESTSVLVLETSTATLDNCSFESAERFSVYFYRGSRGIVRRCQFGKQVGKGIFCLKDAACHVEDCEFSDCQSGAISVADGSSISVTRSTFYNAKSSCIHGMKNCVIEVSRCMFDACEGNGVNFEFSQGFVTHSTFSRFEFPAIAVFGHTANPVITDCRIRNCSAIAVVARDACTPTFRRVTINNIGSHGFSLSDFSRPLIEDCLLMGVARQPFAIFNGVTPILIRNIIEARQEPVWMVMTLARPTIARNMVWWGSDRPPKESCQVSHHGQIKECSGNTLTWKGNTQLLTCVPDGLNSFGHVDEPAIPDDSNCGTWEPGPERAVANLAVAAPPFKPQRISTRSPICRTKGRELRFLDSAPTAAPRPLRSFAMTVRAASARPELPRLPPPKDRPQQVIDITTLYKNEIRGARTPDLGVCTMCRTSPADRVYSPCGHKVVCKKCAQNVMDGDASLRLCNLCQTPAQQCTEVYLGDRCVICMDEQCDTILLPCGHQCCCYEDAARIWTENRVCPICQRRITSFRHQFPIFGHESHSEREHTHGNPVDESLQSLAQS